MPTGTQDLPRRRLPAPASAAPAAVFLLVFSLYAATACRTVGPGDSGELTAVMSTWGVAHAPGYPLLSLIGNLVSRLPHPGEPAFILNLLSGFFGALAAAVVATAVLVLTGSAWASLAAGLALGASRVFWEYSLVVEVFSLNSLMAALLLLCLACFMKSIEKKKPAAWPLMAAAAAASTAVTHHLTLALLALPVLLTLGLLLIPASRRGLSGKALVRAVTLAAAAGALGLVFLIYLPLAARGNPVLDWDHPVDLPGLLRLLKREDFGSGTLMSPWAVATTVLESGIKVSPVGKSHFLRFWLEIPRSFGWVFPLFTLAGVLWAILRSRMTALCGGLFIAMLAVFFARVNSPLLPLYLGVTERFYILPHVMVAFFGGLGIARLLDAIHRWKLRIAPAAGILAAAGVLPMVVVLKPHVDMSSNTFTGDFGANFMAGLPDSAILLSQGDLQHNAFYYRQLGLKRRGDVEFIDQQKLTYPWYVDQVRRRGRFRLPGSMRNYSADPATHSRAWLDLNVGDSPLATVEFRDQSAAGDYVIRPRGLWWRVWPKGDAPSPATEAAEFEAAVGQWNLRSVDHHYHSRSWENAQKGFYPRALAMLGGLKDLAEDLETGSAPLEADPAAEVWLEKARGMAGWTPSMVLAVRVEVYLRILADGLADYGALEGPAPLIRKAIAMAEEAVRLDSTNVLALQTLAGLIAADPAGADPGRDVDLYRRLALLKPGSEEIVGALVQKAIDRMARPESRDLRLLSDAIEAERRLIQHLEHAAQISGDPYFKGRLDTWRDYLRRSEAMAAR